VKNTQKIYTFRNLPYTEGQITQVWEANAGTISILKPLFVTGMMRRSTVSRNLPDEEGWVAGVGLSFFLFSQEDLHLLQPAPYGRLYNERSGDRQANAGTILDLRCLRPTLLSLSTTKSESIRRYTAFGELPSAEGWEFGCG
jgi:hypothetical protein